MRRLRCGPQNVRSGFVRENRPSRRPCGVAFCVVITYKGIIIIGYIWMDVKKDLK